jgi:hypothetical protein
MRSFSWEHGNLQELFKDMQRNMHKKCQFCESVRQYLVAFLIAGIVATVSVQAGFSQEVTLWGAFAGAVITLMWFGYRQRK